MKTIRLKQLKINNFKGIKALKLDFGTDGNNTIYGANGSGKTTVFDSFTWLLFGKDSQGKSDFEYADSARSFIGFRTVQDYMGTQVTGTTKGRK